MTVVCREPAGDGAARIVSGVLGTLSAVKDESELAGVAGELTQQEIAALADASIHPWLQLRVSARSDVPDGE